MLEEALSLRSGPQTRIHCHGQPAFGAFKAAGRFPQIALTTALAPILPLLTITRSLKGIWFFESLTEVSENYQGHHL